MQAPVLGLLAAALLACSIQHAVAQGGSQFTVQGSAVKILFPPGNRARTINMALADFGKPLYGGSLNGNLVYPSEDKSLSPDGLPHRCGERQCEFACDDFSVAKPPFNITKQPGQQTIWLVDRGPSGYNEACYFLTKAYNAQQAGADAVLVADDRDGPLTTAIAPEEETVAHLLKDLKISAALITKADGDFLKSLLKDQTLVTLSLNWTNIEPRQSHVVWELWGSTNDECGTLCDQQAAFVRAMRPVATELERQGLAEFHPHYLIWPCPPMYTTSEECKNQCIMDGSYCAPDPDGSLSEGYSGINVLNMNLAHLCFGRLARQAGSPWLWWDFTDSFSGNCTTANKRYTKECADEIFNAVGGPGLLEGRGKDTWEACIASGDPKNAPGNFTLDIFEQELGAQMGGWDTAPVSILPTVRINGQQYRGSLDVSGVARAICAAFPLGMEPTVCTEKWVSENECEVDGEGWNKCRVGDKDAQGRTRCINTFDGYKCECGQGWVRSITSDGKEVCEDLNECLATNVAYTDKDCACDRCACINTRGSYKCTGPLPNKCTAEFSFGGCWRDTVEGQLQHACVDTFTDYRRLSARGTATTDWYKCQCPPCFTPNDPNAANPTCKAACPLAQCQNGVCTAPSGDGSGGGVPAGGGGGTSSGGMSGWSMILVVLVSVGATTGGMYAVYHYVLRQRMEGEIRDIMSQYMPLDSGAGGDRPNTRRGPGGGGAYTSLAVVNEADETENAPFMAPAGLPNSGTGTRSGASGQHPQPFLAQQQRTAFGSLVAPPQAGEGFATASSYKPPELENGGGEGGAAQTKRSSTSGGGAAEPQTGATSTLPTPLANNAPLLGDGPL